MTPEHFYNFRFIMLDGTVEMIHVYERVKEGGVTWIRGWTKDGRRVCGWESE